MMDRLWAFADALSVQLTFFEWTVFLLCFGGLFLAGALVLRSVFQAAVGIAAFAGLCFLLIQLAGCTTVLHKYHVKTFDPATGQLTSDKRVRSSSRILGTGDQEFTTVGQDVTASSVGTGVSNNFTCLAPMLATAAAGAASGGATVAAQSLFGGSNPCPPGLVPVPAEVVPAADVD